MTLLQHTCDFLSQPHRRANFVLGSRPPIEWGLIVTIAVLIWVK